MARSLSPQHAPGPLMLAIVRGCGLSQPYLKQAPSPVCLHSSDPLGAQLPFQWPAKLEVTPNTLLFGSVFRAQAKSREVMEPFLPPWSPGLTYSTKSCPLLL